MRPLELSVVVKEEGETEEEESFTLSLPDGTRHKQVLCILNLKDVGSNPENSNSIKFCLYTNKKITHPSSLSRDCAGAQSPHYGTMVLYSEKTTRFCSS